MQCGDTAGHNIKTQKSNQNCWLGAQTEVGEPAGHQEEEGEQEEDKEPDAGGLRDDRGGDGDVETSLYSSLAVVQLEGEVSRVHHPETVDVKMSDVAVSLTVVPVNQHCQNILRLI